MRIQENHHLSLNVDDDGNDDTSFVKLKKTSLLMNPVDTGDDS
jgi:hypothetical protein